jgi:hypothetical protein
MKSMNKLIDNKKVLEQIAKVKRLTNLENIKKLAELSKSMSDEDRTTIAYQLGITASALYVLILQNNYSVKTYL